MRRPNRQWQTDDIKQLVERICGNLDTELSVSTSVARGSYDTTWIYVNYKPYGGETDWLTIVGFQTTHRDNRIDRDDIAAEMIEMRSIHSDSDGGIETEHEVLNTAAFRIKKALKALGWSVVPRVLAIG